MFSTCPSIAFALLYSGPTSHYRLLILLCQQSNEQYIQQERSRHWREAYFEFRDEIENCLLSVSCLETRTRFCPPNLEPRDEIENFVHRISGLETRSRILFPKSRNSRRDRDFLIILPKHISKSEKRCFP